MAYLEEILPELRKGRKARRACWPAEDRIPNIRGISWESTIADDWELLPEPVRVADYLVEARPTRLMPYYIKETHPIGRQPEGSVLVPGSEREVAQ